MILNTLGAELQNLPRVPNDIEEDDVEDEVGCSNAPKPMAATASFGVRNLHRFPGDNVIDEVTDVKDVKDEGTFPSPLGSSINF
jgi:hypothetical protein